MSTGPSTHESRLFLAGTWVDAPLAQEIRAPWSGDLVAVSPCADAHLATRAVDLATDAAPRLAAWPAWKRRDFLHAVAAGIERHAEALVSWIVAEAGKPVFFARAEVTRAVQTFRLGAEESTRLGGEALLLDHAAGLEGVMGAWTRVPAGPVLAITPFNFPLNLVAHKLAPAFALGAPVVLKPAPQTPQCALLLAHIVEEAGAPPGLLSVIPTDNACASQLVEDPRFAVVSFTGSASVGWGIKSRAPRARTLLELGGNAAVILAPDADLDTAVPKVVAAAYAYAGQVCIKTQRVFVPASRAAEITERLVEATRRVGVADPSLPETRCGSLIDGRAAERVRTWLDEAVAAGAEVHCGGERSGNRLEPAVVTGAREGLRLVDEEIFGPVLTVHPYADLDDACRAVARGRYGLQAGLFTSDTRVVAACFRALPVGALVVNDASTLRVDAMPYGGVKDSGLGREGVRYAVDEMSEKKLLVLRT